MRLPRQAAASIAMAATLSVLIGFALAAPQIANRAIGADVIVTAAPVYDARAALRGGERFPKGAQLLRIHDGKAEPLVTGFAATADASVSFDGTRVLFAGKQTANNAWEIFELVLADGSLRKLIAGRGDIIRPLYLPMGQLVYARRNVNGFQLQVAGRQASSGLAQIEADPGATVLPLSYLRGSTIPSDVLRDGRILFESEFPLGSGSTPELFLVYSDGSGVESYRCDHGTGVAGARWGGKQLASGDVVFTHGASLARFTSSLSHEAAITAPKARYAGAIAETASGDWLMSARTAPETHYSLKMWPQGMAVASATAHLETVWADTNRDIVEPVLIAPRTRPKHHPSALHPWDYANLLALDARLSRAGDLRVVPSQVRMEAMDDQGKTVVTGTAPVEADGSFFVQAPADRAIRFALLDARGAVLRRERGWFWMRRGEQRYCVGCHTGPERSPENRVPAVLLKTTTPVDLTAAKLLSGARPAAQGGN